MRSLAGALLGLLVRAWLLTLRLTFIVDPALAPTRSRPSGPGLRPWKPFVLAFWHGQQFALLRWAASQRMAALVSRSRDGELVAAALARLGIASARGSSSRGGAAALRAIVRRLREGRDAAFAVDGPRGPARVVKGSPGAVGAAIAARLSGGVVVPMAAACARCHVFSRAWDCFELPLPFTRVAVVLGAPLSPDEATPEALGAAIDRARAEAERAIAVGATPRPGLMDYPDAA